MVLVFLDRDHGFGQMRDHGGRIAKPAPDIEHQFVGEYPAHPASWPACAAPAARGPGPGQVFARIGGLAHGGGHEPFARTCQHRRDDRVFGHIRGADLVSTIITRRAAKSDMGNPRKRFSVLPQRWARGNAASQPVRRDDPRCKPAHPQLAEQALVFDLGARFCTTVQPARPRHLRGFGVLHPDLHPDGAQAGQVRQASSTRGAPGRNGGKISTISTGISGGMSARKA
jgi:hypothetical protein